MQKLGFSKGDNALWPKAISLRLCDWPEKTWWTCKEGIDCWYAQMFLLTTVTGSPSPGARLRSLPLVPSTLHTALFDSDGSWKPGDIRGCNNINALRQVFKSGTCLIIITTYVLFILLQRDKSSWCSQDGFVFSSPPSLPPSLLSSFPVLGEERPQFGKRARAGGEWWGQQWSANHLFTFGICIMRQGANGSPGWLETGWHAFSFNGHTEETSNPSWHFS